MSASSTSNPLSPPRPAAERLSPGAGSIVVGKFELIELVGQGGMGSVWTAKHLSLGVDVAIKFIDAETPELRSRFAHEAQAVARIQSPHVVHVHDFGTDEGGRPYIAMELLRGEELGVRLDREGRIPLSEVEQVLGQAAKGLGKAHQAGVVHRDIKPDNIFLVDDEDGFLVKLLDFGIAKIDVLGSSVHHKTSTGSLMGTPLFMSPEQVMGSRKLDSRSDLYSLAVVAYRALTGVVPHDAPALGELIVNISTKPPPPPSSILELPASLDEFFAKALAKEPADRWSTAREMSDAFSHAARGESLATLPVSSPGRSEISREMSRERLLGGSGPPSSSSPLSLVGTSPAIITPAASALSPLTVTAAPVPSPKSVAVGPLDAKEHQGLSSTAHAQTLPNVSAPPPAKSRAGFAAGTFLLVAGLAAAAFFLRPTPTEERLAKSGPLLDPSFASGAPAASAPLGSGVVIGIPDVPDAPASAAPQPPPVASAAPPGKTATPTKPPPAGKRRWQPGGKRGTNKAGRGSDAGTP